MIRKVPLIVILGSTGVGKTKLSIELAQKFGGEIISADSMQLYKGLDIATAKATTEEQAAAPHHMLSVIEPGQPFTVVHFRDAVLPIVNDMLHRKSKMPIVVGGTNYYIESLLWKVLISSADRGLSDTSDSEGEETWPTKTISSRMLEASSMDSSLTVSSEEFYAQPSETLHNALQRLDPVMAARLHPNNKRKIIRALDYFAETNQPLSEQIQKQREMAGGSTLGGPLRYEHIVLFWLRCEQDVLDRRLDARVDGMVAQGLLREIRDFHNSFSSKIDNIDYTKGVLQIIGYKEFVRYLNQFDEVSDQQIRDYLGSGSCGAKPEGLVVLEQCLEELKLVTRRYSKKQKKWINSRFLGNSSRLVPPLYKLDTTDPSIWADTVYGPAVATIEAYMRDEPIPMRPMDKLQTAREGLDNEVSKTCETCQRVFVGEYQYMLHMKSNKHKKMVTRACKQKRRDKEMQA